MRGSPVATLRSFLENPSRPPGTLKYHELQGFLFTVASAPEFVRPSEWMPIVFGDHAAEYASVEEAREIIGELMNLYNASERRRVREPRNAAGRLRFSNRTLGESGRRRSSRPVVTRVSARPPVVGGILGCVP